MSRLHPICCVASLLLAALPLAAADAAGPVQRLSLQSGDIEYRLRLDTETAWLDYLGPAGKGSWPTPTPTTWRQSQPGLAETSGRFLAQPFSPIDLRLLDHAELPTATNGVRGLVLRFEHRSLPAQLVVRLNAWGDTGVFTREVTVTNTSGQPLAIESLPSLAWELPPGAYDLTYLHGGWGHERQVGFERLATGRREFINRRGRSTAGYSPWFCLWNQQLGLHFAAQLAWSGNWQMSFERNPTQDAIESEPLHVQLGMRFDHAGPLTLPPGASFTTPAVAFTATDGDPDDAVNRLHRYQSRFVIPRGANYPPLVQFNSWYPFPGKMTVDEMKRHADAAADLGAEVFVLDAGWYNQRNWEREAGDWHHDPKAFPRGLEELSGHCHDRGLRFGLWFEIENAGLDATLIREHPDWFLTHASRPIERQGRRQLNFALPAVRTWARGVLDDHIRRLRLDWVKLDYNLDIGDAFEPSGNGWSGDTLARHVRGYYEWLDDLRRAWPELVIENCSSGGLRFDLGLLAHTHTSWISDEVMPVPSIQLAYGATIEFTPEACNHWMVGDAPDGRVDLSRPPGWWDFLFRVPMNGSFGISSRILDWDDALRRRARENISLYKRIRPCITGGADTFHLTPPPAHDRPTNWMALQYVSQGKAQSIVMAYRLPGGAPAQVFNLRGLAPDQRYRVRQDSAERGIFTGRQLAADGIRITLDSEWRAAVLELDATDATPTVVLDGGKPGKVFEGIGALSAGASSRLLVDYPEPQRSQILDLLFKPGHGAAFQHLKVEVGGDINSTDGTEPSHQRTRRDLNFQRGYEWWLMKEAKARNPALVLDALQWGAPAWIGDGHFYSRDNAEYLARFLDGAHKVHGLTIDYIGVWNETRYDTGWIKLFRETLDRRGLSQVRLVAADEINNWSIADVLRTDPELDRSVAVIGTHYPKYRASEAARRSGKPLWSSEDGPWKGTWDGAMALARMYNRNYIQGGMTKTIIWSPITSYYDILPLPGSGVMTANTPWSGAFEIQHALWATAHTTQFAQPGWTYLDAEGCGLLPGGGSYVSLRHPNGRDWSVIIETTEVSAPQALTLQLRGGLADTPLHGWRTTGSRMFERLPDTTPHDAKVILQLTPFAIHSFTTTTGQQKAAPASPPSTPFPLPYREDFDTTPVGTAARYFSDQAGVFEVVRKTGGKGRSLRQVITRKGIEWPLHWNPFPETFLGSPNWRDYQVTVAARLQQEGFVSVFGRVGAVPQNEKPPQGFWLKVTSLGTWELGHSGHPLASGACAFRPRQWHNLGLRFKGEEITVLMDDAALATVQSAAHPSGMAGLGSGWHTAEFDHLQITPVP